MYTEYVFENKKYEVAARDIKATLFDIVSTEESKISDLREKAFIETKDQQVAKELQDLYVQQDGLLREVLAASDNLYRTLEKVDTCSRKLKQIENKNLAQIVATIHGDVQEMSQEAVQQQVKEQQPVENNEMVQAEPQAAEEIVQDEGDALANASTSSEVVLNEENNIFKDDKNSAYENGDEIILVPNGAQAEPQAGDAQAPTVEESNTPNENKPEVVLNEENNIFKDDRNSAYENGDEIVLVPNGAQAEPQTTDAPAQVAEAPVENATEEVQQEVAAPEMVNTEEISDTANAEAEAVEPVMTPITEEVADPNAPVITPVAEEAPTSGPLITPVAEEQPMLISSENETGAPLIQPVQEEATGLPLPFITEEGAQVVNPEAATVSLTFKKRSADQPKVIMISGAQASKLRASLATQEALLSAKGMFQAAPEASGDASLEQQLVNNGLLDPDTSAKQAQIEQMMEQANALYSAGRVEEAQNMYNQISVLNKELQGESAGLTK